MEKIFLIGLVLSSIVGVGTAGTMMADQDMGMMDGNGMRMMNDYGSADGYPMMDEDMHEECEEHMEEHCGNMTDEECEEMHEECEEHMHEYYEQEGQEVETIVDEEARYGCPMIP